MSPAPEGPRLWSERHIHLIGPRSTIDATTAQWEDAGWVVVDVRPLEEGQHAYEVWDVHVAVPTPWSMT